MGSLTLFNRFSLLFSTSLTFIMKFTIAILFALMAIASAKICVTVYTDTECSEGAQKQCIDSNKCESSGGYSAKYTCSGDEYTQLTYTNTDCSGEPSGNTTSTANECVDLGGASTKVTCSTVSATAAAGVAALGVVAALLF